MYQQFIGTLIFLVYGIRPNIIFVRRFSDKHNIYLRKAQF